MGLGDSLRRARVRRGMTQTQLAKASDITQATISRLEAGKIHDLKVSALKRLSRALKISMDVLTNNVDVRRDFHCPFCGVTAVKVRGRWIRRKDAVDLRASEFVDAPLGGLSTHSGEGSSCDPA